MTNKEIKKIHNKFSVIISIIINLCLCFYVFYPNSSLANVNILQNPSFEDNGAPTQSPTGWTSSGTVNGVPDTSADYTENGGKDSVYRLTHWKSSAYEITTSQTVTGLQPGTYTLKAWVKTGGGQNSLDIIVSGHGGTALTKDIRNVGTTWTQISIYGINVSAGQAIISLNSDANAGNWTSLDNIELTYDNFLHNSSFEDGGSSTQNPTDWTSIGTVNGAADTSADYTETGGKDSVHRLTHWKSSAYEITTSQTVTGLQPGTYTLKAWVKTGGEQTSLDITVSGYGGTALRRDIPTVGTTWTQISIYDINVSTGQATIAIHSDANAGNWASFDNIELTYDNFLQNSSFEDDGAPTQDPIGWTSVGTVNGVADTSADYTQTGGKDSIHRLTHWKSNAYEITTSQTVTGLQPGTYTLKAWVETGGGQNSLDITVSGHGGTALRRDIAGTPWAQISIDDINVSTGQATIDIHSDANAGNWASFDNVELIRQNIGTIYNDTEWKDTDGDTINAQNGSIINVDGTYYWYGVYYDDVCHDAQNNPIMCAISVKLYSSTNLETWKYIADVISIRNHNTGALADTSWDGWTGRVVARHYYDNSTSSHKYILIVRNNGLRFLQDDNPEGEFTEFAHVQQTANFTNMTGHLVFDHSIFEETIGGTKKVYLISLLDKVGFGGANDSVNIVEISGDYSDLVDPVTGSHTWLSNITATDLWDKHLWSLDMNTPDPNIASSCYQREAPAIFKKGGNYYLLASQTNGWGSSNTWYEKATSITGFPSYCNNWVKVNTMPDSYNAFDTQHNFVLPIYDAAGTSPATYMYIGDRWSNSLYRKLNLNLFS
jgi:hypothetical protein